MFKSSLDTLEQFKHILLGLPADCYTQSCSVLSDSSIGQHTRHVIELYLCLLNGYETADVSYDRRERNLKIAEELPLAIERLTWIQGQLERPNKPINVRYEMSGTEICLDSNYHREVMYNLEHTIHHHALIKVGIQQLTDQQLPENFGVAPSTIQYRKACAQ